MKLFNTADPSKNHLPYDGTVQYYGVAIANQQHYYHQLLHTIDWEHDKALIFGKLITTKRKVAWCGDKDFAYKYSGIEKVASPWNAILFELKSTVENITGETFNSCLLNLYHDGNEGMTWHSDGEKDLQKNGAIASVSFGAERKFSFEHKVTKEKIDIVLENGSILLMKDETQTHWLHRLPPSTRILSPRINLTFRTITEPK
ncbi:alpha-ketoglutarate-dependent dioxygenase AlkB family protein [Sphingobacterium bovistauri]|uniref:Alpha-ketoglutarate-dependent dioxygenase AlkB n=1 Tax=Sphingobacterium bovistauri TaxID=2781959 RepID=A0ABS7Z7B2_9SPHI|nr:alpha-ketoglutarate-dependent dioxygenase AlkB [Sphingobacterium bovistauri]MCA5006076.1 alpha-ketoglutarate-dependent dioxygenase AlkB [Sphingobacterium bovistauri]